MLMMMVVVRIVMMVTKVVIVIVIVHLGVFILRVTVACKSHLHLHHARVTTEKIVL